MIHRRRTKVAAFVMAAVMLFGSMTASPCKTVKASEEATPETIKQINDYSNERIETNYTNVCEQYQYQEYLGEPVSYKIADIYRSGGDSAGILTSETNGYTKEDQVLRLVMNDTAELVVNVKEQGLYCLQFDYYSYGETILPVEMGLKLNGNYPFYEARRILLEDTWTKNEVISLDRYENEIVSIPDKKMQWKSQYMVDASGRYFTPFFLQLDQGENRISLNIKEGSLLLGNITLSKGVTVLEYQGAQKAEGNHIFALQAEEVSYRNDYAIRAASEYNANLFPYNSKKKVLNIIDGASFKDAGQSITFEQTINAEQAGWYYLAMNYRQSDKADFPVFINVAVDGSIPNTEFQNYPLPYSKDYKRSTLKNSNGDKLSIYLEEGIHTISFTLTLDPVREVLEGVERIMSEINNLSLEVTKVVGTNKDKYRDFQLENYIPGIGDMLNNWADELEAMHDKMLQYNPDTKKIAAFSSIFVASNQLRSLAEKPNELLYRISELATSTNSINKFLANLIDAMTKNNLSLDSVHLYQDGSAKELPAKVGFFKSLWLSIVRFFNSFIKQAYSTSNVDKSHLQIWVNRSRMHLEVMQKMIDEDFTAKTGIKVDLSLMPDQNKLILANASGDSPDIATGINYAQPFELAIRGAVKDLTEFSDFAEIAGRYNEGLLVPATIGDGIYALPETMNFWVLFYRSDVLERIGLSIPNTMDDVRNMLTDLQMRGLNFYYPTAGMVGLKNFHGTTPLLFQNEASLYSTYAGDTTINSEEAVRGFKELTDLFTIYNVPKDVPNFYQHFRNGDYPIGIADFNVYNLISNAAPEIASSWGISVVPGVTSEDGEVMRYTSAGMESTVMFGSTLERENQAWEFMKWWSSSEVQAEFGQTMQITYGDEYLWSTANAEAFAQLPINSENKKVILEQNKWIMEPPRILGTYMLEREISNAYNSVVVDGKSLRITLDNAVKRIDRETKRKLEEFGYLENGEVVIPYEVPTIEKVREILGKTAVGGE